MFDVDSQFRDKCPAGEETKVLLKKGQLFYPANSSTTRRLGLRFHGGGKPEENPRMTASSQSWIQMKRRDSMDAMDVFVGSINDANGCLPLSDVSGLKDNRPLLGNAEVPLVTCTAAASELPAEVKWLTGTLAG